MLEKQILEIRLNPLAKPTTLASITMPRQEFNDLCDELGTHNLITAQDIHKHKQFGHIALIHRDPTTEFIFTRYDIPCNTAIIMIQGSILTAYRPDENLN